MPDSARKDRGPYNYSRWLTCANRVLRPYISEINSAYQHKILASFIMKTNAPILFDIKKNHSVKYGPTHLFKVIPTM